MKSVNYSPLTNNADESQIIAVVKNHFYMTDYESRQSKRDRGPLSKPTPVFEFDTTAINLNPQPEWTEKDHMEMVRAECIAKSKSDAADRWMLINKTFVRTTLRS